MRYIIIISILLLSVVQLSAKDSNSEKEQKRAAKKELKAQKRAQQAVADSLYFVAAVNSVDSQNYIYKMTSITPSGGATNIVTSNVNFLMVQGDKFTFQTSTGFGGGSNGMGGITTTGLVNDVEKSEDKHGNLTYQFNITGNLFNARVSLYINHGSNSSDMYLNLDKGMGSVSIIGSIYPIGGLIFTGDKAL